MFTAFSILGQAAARGFNDDPTVKRSINKFTEFIDVEKLNYLGQ